MKKILSMLLAAAMLLAVAPMAVSAYEADQISDIEAKLTSEAGNLAVGKTVIYSSAIPEGRNNDWAPSKLNDGSLNYNATSHETCGFHSQHAAFDGDSAVIGKNHEEWAGVDFGEETEFDTLVVYPNRPQDSDFEGTNGTCPSFPNAFRVQVSNDGESWSTLTITVNGDDANAAQTIYNFDPPAPEPVTINFTAVKARYVRFVGVSLNWLAEGFYMKLSELAVYNKGFKPGEYTYSENVLAKKPLTVVAGGAHEDVASNWHLVNINNGDRYEMVTFGGNNDYGQFAGFHSMPAQQEKLAIDFELGEGTTLNQFIIYPGTEKFSGTAHNNNGDHKIYFPANFTVEVSTDGQNWTKVVDKTGYSVTEYAPQVFEFDKVTATYLRFSMLNLTDYVKLSEIEAYDTTKTLTANKDEVVVKEKTNVAIGATVIASGVINSGDWNVANLNNGVLETKGGFTSTEGATDTALWVGYDLGAVTKINSIVLTSALSTDERDAEWSGIPKKFEIQTSTNGFNWNTIKTCTNKNVPEFSKAYTYSFNEVDARYVRIVAVENYAKGSDGNKSYIQLAEMEVVYTPKTNTPPAATGDVSLAVVFVATLAVISGAAVMIRRRRYQ